MTFLSPRGRSAQRARTAQNGLPRRQLGGARPALVALGAAVLGLVGTGCAPVTNDAAPATTSEPAVPAPTPSAKPNELRYVSSSAAPCASVWVSGAVLPADYEWCIGDDGAQVSGVRIGSCEVIAYRNEMYAVPGRPVMTSMGALQLDPQFLASLTSCKRRPAPAGTTN